MYIKGLTDPESVQGRGIERIGKLRKGGEKQQRKNSKTGEVYHITGKDLDHFRPTFEPHYDWLADTFTELYGDTPETLLVRLAGDTYAEAFESAYEEWDAAQTLKVRCDGENQVLWLDENTQRWMKAKKPCRNLAVGQGCDLCSVRGTLKVIPWELFEATGVFGYMAIETGSKHDVIQLSGALLKYERMYAGLFNVPFIVGRYDRIVNTPIEDKKSKQVKRAKTNKSLLYIMPLPEWAKDNKPMIRSGERPALPQQVEHRENLLAASYTGPRRVGATQETSVEPEPTEAQSKPELHPDPVEVNVKELQVYPSGKKLKSGQDKMHFTFRTESEHEAYGYSRDVFRKAGWDADMEPLTTEGTYVLEPALSAKIKQAWHETLKDTYWKIDSLDPEWQGDLVQVDTETEGEPF